MATVAAHLRPYEPKPQQNTVASFLLAVMMHALLVGALWISVQWQLEPQGEIVAELWGALPEPVVVAPPPPPPPTVEAPVPPSPVPQLPDPDIALEQKKKIEAAERMRREEAERLKVEKLKREQAEQAKAEQRKRDEAERQKAEKLKREQIERQRAEQLKREEAQLEAARKAEEARVLAQAGAGKPGGSPAAGSGRGDPNYAAQLISVIRPRIVFAVPEGTSPSVYADYQVDLLPTGEILSVRLLKASGLPGYDAAVERAIRRTDPFPRKRDGTVDRTVTIRFRPVDAQ